MVVRLWRGLPVGILGMLLIGNELGILIRNIPGSLLRGSIVLGRMDPQPILTWQRSLIHLR